MIDFPEPHAGRTRELLAAHPELRKLFGPNPWTALAIVLVTGAQLGLAVALREAPWWLNVATAFLVGAFLSHNGYVLIHETTHNLVFRNKTANRLLGCVANLPLVVPSSESFRLYHLSHHQHLGDYDGDLDQPEPWEVRLFSRSFIGKLAWQFAFTVLQSLRTLSRRKTLPFFSGWVLVNLVLQLGVDALILHELGLKSLLYLVASLVFGVGPHPLGARWIQEHWRMRDGQGTYSYYGPLNLLSFNVGFHVEHHDLPHVPWNRLPQLRRLAKEFYDSLYAHPSWTRLWLRYLTDPELHMGTRGTWTSNVSTLPLTPPGSRDPAPSATSSG